MAPSLCALPAELVENISKFLPDKELFNFRLTCVDINAKTVHHFANAWFWFRTVSLSRRSLQFLLDISAHPTFGPCVRRLYFSAHYLWDPATDERHDPNETDPYKAQREAYASLTEDARKQYRRHVCDEIYVREACIDKEMLTTALRALPNCHVIGFTSVSNAPGWLGFEAETGVLPTQTASPQAQSHIIQHLFPVVLGSILSSQVRLERFEMPSYYFTEAALEPSIFHIPTWELDRFRVAFSHLRSLTMDLRTWKWKGAHKDSLLTSFRHFLSLTDRLEELEIFGTNDVERDEVLLNYSAESPDVKLPQLRTLELGNMSMKEKTLIAFTGKFRDSLEAIWLDDFGIIGTWHSVFSAFRGRHRLKTIWLDHLGQDNNSIGFRKSDPEIQADPLNPTKAQSYYEGDAMQLFLADLITRITVLEDEDEDEDDY